jgi:hypothetical protein
MAIKWFQEIRNRREAKKFAKENEAAREQLAVARARANADAARARANAAARARANAAAARARANAAAARARQEAANLNAAIKASIDTKANENARRTIKARLQRFIQKLLSVFMKSGDNRIMKLIKSLLRVYVTKVNVPKPKVNVPKPKVNVANLARYRVQNAGGGGDCFYLSLRLAAGLTDTVQEMRNKITAKILSNWNSNHAKTIHLNGKIYKYGNRHEYANRMKGKCWAGHDEIEAASHVYKRNITIVTGTNSMATYPMEQNHPEWPRVYIRANATSANREANVRMSHFQAYVLG